MNPKIKKIWTKALRSGEYCQTTGTLKDDAGFCCLGVLTDLYAKKNKIKNTYRAFKGAGGEESFPTKSVCKWAGFTKEENNLDLDDDIISIRKLAELNDDEISFKKIADYIEKHF